MPTDSFDNLFKQLDEQKEEIEIQDQNIDFRKIYEIGEYIYYVYQGLNLELLHLKVKKVYEKTLITIDSNGIYCCIDTKDIDNIFQNEYDANKMYKDLKES